MAAVAWRNGSRPPMEPLAAVPNGGSPASDQTQQTTADASAQAGPAAAAVPARKLSLALALKDRHIARRFFILAYAWMVLCMVYYGECVVRCDDYVVCCGELCATLVHCVDMEGMPAAGSCSSRAW